PGHGGHPPRRRRLRKSCRGRRGGRCEHPEARAMTVRHVATIGHPTLRVWAQPIDPARLGSLANQELIDDLIDTKRYYQGAGIAAPQVMVPLRAVAIEVSSNLRYPYKPDIPLTILVNPELEALSEETFANNEGCLSVPGIRAVTHRYVEIG